jgi:glyoxylase-like metal-dependent hydrolase (beta-lactamase superfamily II)
MPKKKTKRKWVVAIISVVVLLLIGVGGVQFKMGYEQRSMNSLDTGEVLPGIYAIKTGYVNMFIIKVDSAYIAIDTGANANGVKQGLAQLGISSDDVAAVLLTHSHGDHTAALSLFDKAEVYAAKQELANQPVADGKVLTILGREIRVIATPGHAADSVCYLYDGSCLFAGDNLSLNGDTVGMFNSFFNKSDEQQEADIAKLAGLGGVEHIVTAHYGLAHNPVFTGHPVFPNAF